jgi:hypothetical protein
MIENQSFTILLLFTVDRSGGSTYCKKEDDLVEVPCFNKVFYRGFLRREVLKLTTNYVFLLYLRMEWQRWTALFARWFWPWRTRSKPWRKKTNSSVSHRFIWREFQ